MCFSYINNFFLLFLIFSWSCVHINSPEKISTVTSTKENSAPLLVKETTEIPNKYTNTIAQHLKDKWLKIPAGTVWLSETGSTQVELGYGPSVEYAIKNQFIPPNTKLLVFERRGVWLFTSTYSADLRGWVHSAAIKELESSKEELTINTNALPVLFSAKEIAEAKSYPEKLPVLTKVPKGAIFLGLKNYGKETLVWIKETNSLMWVERNLVY